MLSRALIALWFIVLCFKLFDHIYCLLTVITLCFVWDLIVKLVNYLYTRGVAQLEKGVALTRIEPWNSSLLPPPPRLNTGLSVYDLYKKIKNNFPPQFSSPILDFNSEHFKGMRTRPLYIYILKNLVSPSNINKKNYLMYDKLKYLIFNYQNRNVAV